MENRQQESQYIVYLCPVGELNRQLELYFAQSRDLFGANKAHQYMPHCTLTGFFTDLDSSVSYYLDALELSVREAKQHLSSNVAIQRLVFSQTWHGIELQADGIKQLVANFAQIENSPTRKESLRLKDWLHLSLAYGFNSQHGKQLEQLARQTIKLESEVHWELRFYQKNSDWTWYCFKSWSMSV